MMVVAYPGCTRHRPARPDRARRPRSLDLAIIAAALSGGAIGFLWYNAYPADVFMGDTGSFALGGALAAMAVFTKTEFLLVVIGGVFVIEALSVLIQVISFKTHRQARVPDGADPPPLRDAGLDRDQDHRALLDRGGDLRRHGFVLYYLFFSQYRDAAATWWSVCAARGWRRARRSRRMWPGVAGGGDRSRRRRRPREARGGRRRIRPAG